MDYRKAIGLDGNFGASWNDLGALLGKNPSRVGEAEEEFNNAIGIDPDFPSAWANLGLLLVNHPSRHEESEAVLHKD